MKNRLLVVSLICFMFLIFCVGTGFAFDNFIGAGQWDPVAMTYKTSSDFDSTHTGKQTIDGEPDTLYQNYYHGNDGSGWGMWMSAYGGGGAGNPSPTGFTGKAWIAYDFGQSYPVKEMLVWNFNQSGATSRGLKGVTIKVSTNGLTWTTVFTGNLTRGTGVGFTYDPVTDKITGGGMPPTNTIAINQDVQYVVIDANSTHNLVPDYYGLSEVRWNLLNPYASTPNPVDDSNSVATNTTLSWQGGEYATGHQVYFGTNYYDVLDATPSNPLGVYKGTQSLGYSPGTLAMDRTYYWRVDETNGSTVWKGNIWSFSTVTNIVIDSFDTNVTSNWFSAGGTGVPSQTVASCGGTGAMLLTYNNHLSPYYSAAERYYSAPNYLNLTANNVKSISLTFRGAATNGKSNAVLFVELKDIANRVARVQYTDPNAVLETTCKEWNIDLAAFKTAPNPTNFDLANVSQIRLGVGSGQQAASPTSGEVLFDNLVMYQERCIIRPAGDLTTDCVVNIDDLEVLVRFWLDDNRFPQ